MMKKLIFALAAGLALAASAGAAPAPPPAPGEEVRIPFANMGGIRNFHAEDDDVVYLQDYRWHWYRAQLVGTCPELSWAMRIGIDTRGTTMFDRYSSLLVNGERCQLGSLTRSGPPPPRAKHARRSGH
jgi:hypothetical protein